MLREFPRGLEEQSGKVAEYFLFGRVRVGDPVYQREARACMAIKDDGAKEICAIRLMRKFQPFDPKNPTKKVLKDLLLSTADLSDLKKPEDVARLEILTTVDSIADWICHADVLTLLRERDSNSFRIVKIDYSKYPPAVADPESSKADLVISDIPDPSENPRAYQEKIAEIAMANAAVLKTKTPIEL